MKVLIPLVLAVVQLLMVGFAVPAGAPGVANARNLGDVEQTPTVRVGLAQIQPEDAPRAPDFFSSPFSSPFGDSSASSGGTMRVQIDMFSGRPNPSWDITSQEADQVRLLFRQLPERTAGARPERLGYRGLIVNGDGVRDLGLTRILIGGGVVIAEGFQGVRYLSDADRGLERQIFHTGRTRLDPTDYAAFKSIAFP
jgi:hypothetical protein